MSWENVVILPREDEDGDNTDVINMKYSEIVSCAVDLLDEAQKKGPDFMCNLKENFDEKIPAKILFPNVLNCLGRISLSSTSGFCLIATVLTELGFDLSNIFF